jgi:hypothetical protein
LRNATIRILVIDPTLAAVRHAIRLLKGLGAEEIGRQTIVVLNRRWAPGDGDLSLKDIETALKRVVDVTVPFGKNVLVVAENSGELVAAKNSPVTEALSALVHELSGRPRPKPSLLARLFKSAARPLQDAPGEAAAPAPKAAPIIVAATRDEPEEPEITVQPRRNVREPSYADTFGDPYQPNKH